MTLDAMTFNELIHSQSVAGSFNLTTSNVISQKSGKANKETASSDWQVKERGGMFSKLDKYYADHYYYHSELVFGFIKYRPGWIAL
jgi:hypothetical protein